MCSVLTKVRPIHRALALSLRLGASTEGSSYAATQIKRLSPGVNSAVDPLRVSARCYCSRMAKTQGLLFRQVG